MRMWMVNPEHMCTQHLIAEHYEIHMFIGIMKRSLSLQGYIDGNMLEPESLASRHDELVSEMQSRGYNHKSPINEDELLDLLDKLPEHIRKAKMNVEDSHRVLELRCNECRERMLKARGK